MSNRDDSDLDDLVDPADVISALTVEQTATALAGLDPVDIVDEVMDTTNDWWDGIDPSMLAVLDDLATGLLEDASHDVAMIGLGRAGYRLGRILLGDGPHPDQAPPMIAYLDTIASFEGTLLLDHLPREATPLTIWLSEELIRRNGWWQGRTDEIGADDAPEDLQELRGAGIVAADLGWATAMIEHDLLAGRLLRG